MSEPVEVMVARAALHEVGLHDIAGCVEPDDDSDRDHDSPVLPWEGRYNFGDGSLGEHELLVSRAFVLGHRVHAGDAAFVVVSSMTGNYGVWCEPCHGPFDDYVMAREWTNLYRLSDRALPARNSPL